MRREETPGRVTVSGHSAQWFGLVLLVLFAGLMTVPGSVLAGKPQVVWVELNQEARHWRITGTLSHDDAGDYHFMDRWQVLTPDGDVLGEEAFITPRVQAPERITTLRDIRLPQGTREIRVRVHDTLHGWGPTLRIPLNERRGEHHRIRTDTDW